MNRVGPAALVVVLLVGCGRQAASDDVVALSDVCGGHGPARVLSLLPNEAVAALRPLDDAGRLAAIVEVRDDADETIARRVATTSACGEDTVTIATDIAVLEGEGEALFGCDPAVRTIFRLDPTGGAGPTPLVSPVSCRFVVTDAGLVVVTGGVDDAWGTLLLVSGVDGTTTELVDATVRVPPEGPTGPSSLHADDDGVLVLTRDSEVLFVPLPPGEPSVSMTGVADLRVSSDGSRLAWQAGTVEPDPTVRSEGPIFVQPADAGPDEAIQVATAHLGWSPLPFFDDYIAFRTAAGGGELVFRWPDLAPVPLPAGARFRGQSPDGAVWYGLGDARATAEWTVRPGEAPRLLYEGPGYPGRHDDGIEVFVPGEGGTLQAGTLLLVPWSGGEPRTLAGPVHFGRVRAPDGSVLSVDEREPEGVGDLVVYPVDAPSFVVDVATQADSLSLNRRRPVGDDIVYRVIDPERGGLWRARLE